MKKLFQQMLVHFNVTKSDFRVVDSNFYHRLSKTNGDLSLILGESYMAGEWESDDLTEFFRKILSKWKSEDTIKLFKEVPTLESLRLFLKLLRFDVQDYVNNKLFNDQTIKLSKRVGEQHYDIPDILYHHMLDSHRQYTCAYWKPGVKTLEEAQQAKIDLIINKLQIPDDVEMNILDTGCGWGGLAHAISLRYPKCNIDGISISKEQINYANKKYKSNKLQYIYCDYRDLVKKNKKYDRIVSVGITEHIGYKNYDTYLNICESILKKNGIFLLHTISKPHFSKYIFGKTKYTGDSWFMKYIFPGGQIPIPELILTSAQKNNLMYHHIQNLSISYAKTLDAWYNNFTSNWNEIKKSNPDFFTDEFYRMWEFYLLSCMVAFEKKNIQLTQFVFTKKEYNGMYVFTEKE
jgi:cyclopropane-fatty-acyl-phospholipid synthase